MKELHVLVDDFLYEWKEHVYNWFMSNYDKGQEIVRDPSLDYEDLNNWVKSIGGKKENFYQFQKSTPEIFGICSENLSPVHEKTIKFISREIGYIKSHNVIVLPNGDLKGTVCGHRLSRTTIEFKLILKEGSKPKYRFIFDGKSKYIPSNI